MNIFSTLSFRHWKLDEVEASVRLSPETGEIVYAADDDVESLTMWECEATGGQEFYLVVFFNVTEESFVEVLVNDNAIVFASVENCTQGYYSDGTRCVACDPLECSPGESAETCTGDFPFHDGRCVTCPMGFWSNGSGACQECSPCGVGEIVTRSCNSQNIRDSDTECEACPIDTYRSNEVTCSPCDHTPSTCEFGIIMNRCDVASVDDESSCFLCAAGQVVDSESESCVDCGPNMYADSGVCLACGLTGCDAGFLFEACGSGESSDVSTCTPACPLHTYLADDGSCHDCQFVSCQLGLVLESCQPGSSSDVSDCTGIISPTDVLCDSSFFLDSVDGLLVGSGDVWQGEYVTYDDNSGAIFIAIRWPFDRAQFNVLVNGGLIGGATIENGGLDASSGSSAELCFVEGFSDLFLRVLLELEELPVGATWEGDTDGVIVQGTFGGFEDVACGFADFESSSLIDASDLLVTNLRLPLGFGLFVATNGILLEAKMIVPYDIGLPIRQVSIFSDWLAVVMGELGTPGSALEPVSSIFLSSDDFETTNAVSSGICYGVESFVVDAIFDVADTGGDTLAVVVYVGDNPSFIAVVANTTTGQIDVSDDSLAIDIPMCTDEQANLIDVARENFPIFAEPLLAEEPSESELVAWVYVDGNTLFGLAGYNPTYSDERFNVSFTAGDTVVANATVCLFGEDLFDRYIVHLLNIGLEDGDTIPGDALSVSEVDISISMIGTNVSFVEGFALDLEGPLECTDDQRDMVRDAVMDGIDLLGVAGLLGVEDVFVLPSATALRIIEIDTNDDNEVDIVGIVVRVGPAFGSIDISVGSDVTLLASFDTSSPEFGDVASDAVNGQVCQASSGLVLGIITVPLDLFMELAGDVNFDVTMTMYVNESVLTTLPNVIEVPIVASFVGTNNLPEVLGPVPSCTPSDMLLDVALGSTTVAVVTAGDVTLDEAQQAPVLVSWHPDESGLIFVVRMASDVVSVEFVLDNGAATFRVTQTEAMAVTTVDETTGLTLVHCTEGSHIFNFEYVGQLVAAGIQFGPLSQWSMSAALENGDNFESSGSLVGLGEQTASLDLAAARVSNASQNALTVENARTLRQSGARVVVELFDSGGVPFIGVDCVSRIVVEVMRNGTIVGSFDFTPISTFEYEASIPAEDFRSFVVRVRVVLSTGTNSRVLFNRQLLLGAIPIDFASLELISDIVAEAPFTEFAVELVSFSVSDIYGTSLSSVQDLAVLESFVEVDGERRPLAVRVADAHAGVFTVNVFVGGAWTYRVFAGDGTDSVTVISFVRGLAPAPTLISGELLEQGGGFRLQFSEVIVFFSGELLCNEVLAGSYRPECVLSRVEDGSVLVAYALVSAGDTVTIRANRLSGIGTTPLASTSVVLGAGSAPSAPTVVLVNRRPVIASCNTDSTTVLNAGNSYGGLGLMFNWTVPESVSIENTVSATLVVDVAQLPVGVMNNFTVEVSSNLAESATGTTSVTVDAAPESSVTIGSVPASVPFGAAATVRANSVFVTCVSGAPVFQEVRYVWELIRTTNVNEVIALSGRGSVARVVPARLESIVPGASYNVRVTATTTLSSDTATAVSDSAIFIEPEAPFVTVPTTLIVAAFDASDDGIVVAPSIARAATDGVAVLSHTYTCDGDACAQSDLVAAADGSLTLDSALFSDEGSLTTSSLTITYFLNASYDGLTLMSNVVTIQVVRVSSAREIRVESDPIPPRGILVTQPFKLRVFADGLTTFTNVVTDVTTGESLNNLMLVSDGRFIKFAPNTFTEGRSYRIFIDGAGEENGVAISGQARIEFACAARPDGGLLASTLDGGDVEALRSQRPAENDIVIGVEGASARYGNVLRYVFDFANEAGDRIARASASTPSISTNLLPTFSNLGVVIVTASVCEVDLCAMATGQVNFTVVNSFSGDNRTAFFEDALGSYVDDISMAINDGNVEDSVVYFTAFSSGVDAALDERAGDENALRRSLTQFTPSQACGTPEFQTVVDATDSVLATLASFIGLNPGEDSARDVFTGFSVVAGSPAQVAATLAAVDTYFLGGVADTLDEEGVERWIGSLATFAGSLSSNYVCADAAEHQAAVVSSRSSTNSLVRQLANRYFELAACGEQLEVASTVDTSGVPFAAFAYVDNAVTLLEGIVAVSASYAATQSAALPTTCAGLVATYSLEMLTNADLAALPEFRYAPAEGSLVPFVDVFIVASDDTFSSVNATMSGDVVLTVPHAGLEASVDAFVDGMVPVCWQPDSGQVSSPSVGVTECDFGDAKASIAYACADGTAANPSGECVAVCSASATCSTGTCMTGGGTTGYEADYCVANGDNLTVSAGGDDDSDENSAAIGGGVAAAIVILAVIVWYRRRDKKARVHSAEAAAG